jgi:hypothetical protein
MSEISSKYNAFVVEVDFWQVLLRYFLRLLENINIRNLQGPQSIRINLLTLVEALYFIICLYLVVESLESLDAL